MTGWLQIPLFKIISSSKKLMKFHQDRRSGVERGGRGHFICRLRMDWNQLLKGSDLRRWISGYSQWLPSNKEDHHPGVGMVLSKQLVEEDRVGLEDPFNEEELPAALLDLDRDKAWDQIGSPWFYF